MATMFRGMQSLMHALSETTLEINFLEEKSWMINYTPLFHMGETDYPWPKREGGLPILGRGVPSEPPWCKS